MHSFSLWECSMNCLYCFCTCKHRQYTLEIIKCIPWWKINPCQQTPLYPDPLPPSQPIHIALCLSHGSHLSLHSSTFLKPWSKPGSGLCIHPLPSWPLFSFSKSIPWWRQHVQKKAFSAYVEVECKTSLSSMTFVFQKHCYKFLKFITLL